MQLYSARLTCITFKYCNQWLALQRWLKPVICTIGIWVLTVLHRLDYNLLSHSIVEISDEMTSPNFEYWTLQLTPCNPLPPALLPSPQEEYNVSSHALIDNNNQKHNAYPNSRCLIHIINVPGTADGKQPKTIADPEYKNRETSIGIPSSLPKDGRAEGSSSSKRRLLRTQPMEIM